MNDGILTDEYDCATCTYISKTIFLVDPIFKIHSRKNWKYFRELETPTKRAVTVGNEDFKNM